MVELSPTLLVLDKVGDLVVVLSPQLVLDKVGDPVVVLSPLGVGVSGCLGPVGGRLMLKNTRCSCQLSHRPIWHQTTKLQHFKVNIEKSQCPQ